MVKECRGKALLSLAALPISVWGDGGAELVAALAELSIDPSQYAMSMGATGLARCGLTHCFWHTCCSLVLNLLLNLFLGASLARQGGQPEAGGVGGARRAALLERMVELRYIALDNNGLH